MTNLSETARTIFLQALADCNVEQATARHVSTREHSLYIDGEEIALNGLRHIRIIAVGKAANAMLLAVLQKLPVMPSCDVVGVVIAPEPPVQLPREFQYFAGGHPTPNEASFAGARAALSMLRTVAEHFNADHTLCLFLVSGGASAMMELPLDPAISLSDTANFHRTLVASGASISEINCIRKHFSAVKGGRLALAAGNALCRSFLISDVPAGREDALGSGPTIADVSTVAECREILMRYRLLPQFPATVRSFFESATLPETPKPTELHARSRILLDAQDLAKAAAHRAETLGWTAVIDNTCDEWEYQAAAKYLLERLRSLRSLHSRVCLISVGEVIVSLPISRGPNYSVGVGGRNQQFALYAATQSASGGGKVAILSAGSDGIDGNSPATGAIVDENTTREPTDRNAALQALEGFNTFPFLQARNATIVTGPSGNNLRDLRILLAQTAPIADEEATCSAIP